MYFCLKTTYLTYACSLIPMVLNSRLNVAVNHRLLAVRSLVVTSVMHIGGI